MLEYIKGDLFSNTEDCLAHCVSRDFNMGAGVAVGFRQRFGGVECLKQQKPSVGGLAWLLDINVERKDARIIFYLVTKEHYYGKPTYDTLESSLRAMREQCLARNIKTIAMPRIGCGLDKLEWSSVEALLKKIFAETNITLKIYSL